MNTTRVSRLKGLPALLSYALMLPVIVSHANVAMSHEYWLDPLGTHWQAGDTLQADIRNGQDFTGTPFPFDPQGLARGGLISEHQRLALNGRLGDYPAIQFTLADAGLNLLLLETSQRELRYEKYSDFEIFLDYHALESIKQRHKDRGLPERDIVEHYYRYCKAIVDVDSAHQSAGANDKVTAESAQSQHEETTAALQPQNQRFELVAVQNPFEVSKLSLQLLFEQTPLGARQVELFQRDGQGVVTRTTAITDTQGLVSFNVSPAGDYLVNSVLVLESDAPPAHWVTLWTSLFFRQTGQLP